MPVLGPTPTSTAGLTTYTDLVSAVGRWLNRSDLSEHAPDFIGLAEARISRDLRIRAMVEHIDIPTTAGVRYVDVPLGWLEFENLTLATSPARPLAYLTPQQMDVRYPDGSAQSAPAVYTIIGDRVYLGNTPDAVYNLDACYYKRFDALASSETNWLLENHPGVYLFGALAEAAPFLGDDNRVAIWEAKYTAEVRALQTTDDTALRSGSDLRIRVA